MAHAPSEQESTQLELVYDGELVQAGTVPIDYMIDALTGFSSAYSKVATFDANRKVNHRLEVAAIKPGSAHIVVNVIEWVRVNPLAAGVLVTATGMAVRGAYKFAKDIAGVIGAKKHLAGEKAPKPLVNLQGKFRGPTVVIVNNKQEEYAMTKEQYELLKSGVLDGDLDKLTSPLQEGKVDVFEMKHQEETLTKVSAAERPYFRHTEEVATNTKDDIWMEGTLNSLSKDRNRGTFHTVSGKHIPYHYVGRDKRQLLRAFAHQGLVRALCKVNFDADLNPISLNIKRIELTQRALFSHSAQ